MNAKNLATVGGNIATEPQLRETKNGTPVVEFVLASNRRRSASKAADFIPVEVYGTDATNLDEYKAKGHGISVVGRLDYQSWTDKETGELRSRVKLVAAKGGITYFPKGSSVGFNHVLLMGNLTREPEALKVTGGIDKANFGIAVDGMPLADDPSETETDYFNAVAWRGLAGIIADNKHKGDLVQVMGRVSSSSWTDKTTGQNRSKIEITAEEVEFFPTDRAATVAAGSVPATEAEEVTEEDLEDIPF